MNTCKPGMVACTCNLSQLLGSGSQRTRGSSQSRPSWSTWDPISINKNNTTKAGDGWGVKSTQCSYRGPEFSSQDPCQAERIPYTLLASVGICTHIHIGKHTNIHKKVEYFKIITKMGKYKTNFNKKFKKQTGKNLSGLRLSKIS